MGGKSGSGKRGGIAARMSAVEHERERAAGHFSAEAEYFR